jgi:hypothetical protein
MKENGRACHCGAPARFRVTSRRNTMRPRSLVRTSLLILGVSLVAGPGAAQQLAGPRASAADFGSLRVMPDFPGAAGEARMAVTRHPAGPSSRLSTARAAARRRSPWLLPVVGAVAGGALMAGYASYVCRDEECNLSPVPFITGGIGLGAVLGFMVERSL